MEWGIDKILTVTVDNASSNNLTIKYLKRVTIGWATNILSNDFMHVRCCAHIVNLIVCAGLKDIDDSKSKKEKEKEHTINRWTNVQFSCPIRCTRLTA